LAPMRFERTSHVNVSASDLCRYVSDPRNTLSGWPAMKVELVDGSPIEPARQLYRLSSRTNRDGWIVDVRTLAADRGVRIEFGRVGEPSRGWIQFDLEPGADGTTMRSTGEIRMGRLLRAINALRRPDPEDPDRDLDIRVQRWLTAHPSREPGDINER
jgi:hypothetical protein